MQAGKALARVSGCAHSSEPWLLWDAKISCAVLFDHVVNPFMPNVFSHLYWLDKSISNVGVVGWYFSFLFKF